MLVLSRTRGQSVMIGDDIDVTVIDLRGDKVRLGINAPKSVSVHRREVYDAIKGQGIASSHASPRPEEPARSAAAAGPQTLQTPETSKLFQTWKEPASGVESYILTERVAPVQQAFQSPSSSMSADGRYLWFYCAFPPGGHPRYGRTLGVVDLLEQTARHFPETQFGEASPLVDPKTAECYWSSGPEFFKRGPLAETQAVVISRLGEDLLRLVSPVSMASLSTMSADRSALSFDVAVDGKSHLGSAPLNGTPPQVWHISGRAQAKAIFSPTDRDLMLIVEGDSGAQGPANLLILRRGQKPGSLLAAKHPYCPGSAWWSGDGQSVYLSDPTAGVVRVGVEGGDVEGPWPIAGGHSDPADRYLVGGSSGNVTFLNVQTRKEIAIISSTPARLPPSPHFVLGGRYVCYTTTALGRSDVALVPTSRLAAATA